jgi:hypothetical protein
MIEQEGRRQEQPEIGETNLSRNGRDSGAKTFRDWWAFTLSTLAFCISAVGFFVNSLHETEDLRVTLTLPSVIPVGDVPTFKLQGSPGITFINAGTNSIAIHKLEVLHAQTNENLTASLSAGMQTPNYKDCDGSYNTTATSKTDLNAFVIKPSDVAIKQFTITSAALPMKSAAGGTGKDANYNIVLCYDFILSTPLQGEVRTFTRFVNQVHADPNKIDNFYLTSTRPFVLMHYSTNSFQKWWRELFST